MTKDVDYSSYPPLTQYDAIADEIVAGETYSVTNDDNGHGTHVSSIVVSSLKTNGRDSKYNGVAPGADLISIKAFGNDGSGTYMDVIRAID